MQLAEMLIRLQGMRQDWHSPNFEGLFYSLMMERQLCQMAIEFTKQTHQFWAQNIQCLHSLSVQLESKLIQTRPGCMFSPMLQQPLLNACYRCSIWQT
ncbi:hypothetical protein FGO68_gene10201 [Halteria grandinella]|uniref:Uncharacterized protein n=1 Tax=Halteria grandinella TaxID=5974 RepID=A0A8J8P5Y9_HALGN|nr:hypothetical protein FGO68_gene10201 [Halteria grandinella]